MAKGKKGGKGGKKGKKKKEAEVADPHLLTEVDKTFYELQITDLNRKLARLRSLSQELEEKNEQLENNFKTLDDDRADIIMYLKRTLQEKSDEINDLQERLKGLQDVRQTETEEFETQIADLKEDYRQMQEQLTSEIKLLNGKLNSLEEFRVQRDELMHKYEVQEADMEQQEERHKKAIYDIERKFIISKDRLKKEMEDRLLKLSTDFQDATNLRIAATTHRVIRENIAINNELDVILQDAGRLHEENEEYRKRDIHFRLQAQLHEAEKNKALGKNKVQYEIIDRLTKEHESLTQQLEVYKDLQLKYTKQSVELTDCQGEVKNLKFNLRVLEQNLHASRCDRVGLSTELRYANEEVERLSDILIEAVCSVEDAVNLKSTSDITVTISKRENLLVNLLQLMSKVHDTQARKPSLESVQSLSAMYNKGDLGFVPCPVEPRSRFPTKRNIDTQVGSSIENLGQRISDMGISEKKDEDGEEEETEVTDDGGSGPHVREINYEAQNYGSQVVFDDEPEQNSEEQHGKDAEQASSKISSALMSLMHAAGLDEAEDGQGDPGSMSFEVILTGESMTDNDEVTDNDTMLTSKSSI